MVKSKNIKLTETHNKELYAAMLILENPGIAIKVANLIGKPIEKGIDALPTIWRNKIVTLTKSTLLYLLAIAAITILGKPKKNFK